MLTIICRVISTSTRTAACDTVHDTIHKSSSGEILTA
jgi:hypothetical protein